MNATRLRWARDMANANLVVHENDALIHSMADGSAVGIDPHLLPEDFVQLYADLTSVGYANGWI